MVAAMRGGDKDRTQVLRMLLSEIGRKEADDVNAVAQEAVTAYGRILRKSMVEMEKLGQAERVAKLKAEVAIVDEFLPRQIDDAGLEKIVGEVLHGMGPVTKKDSGRVMGAVMKAVAASGVSADAGKVRALVESKIP
jgi:uncharacterized protein